MVRIKRFQSFSYLKRVLFSTNSFFFPNLCLSKNNPLGKRRNAVHDNPHMNVPVQPSNKVVHTHRITIMYHRREDHKLKKNLYLLTYYIFIVWKRFDKNISFVLLYCIVVFYIVIPQRLLGGHHRSGEIRRLHFQTDFHPEDGGSSVLRNFGNHLSIGLVPWRTVWTVKALGLRVFSTESPRSLNFISTYHPDTIWRNIFSNSVHKSPYI